LRHIGVSAGRRGVSHSHVRHHARPLAGPLSPPHAGHRLVRGFVAGQAVPVGHGSGHAYGLDVALYARQIRRGRASRVGHLAVYAVGLHQTRGGGGKLISNNFN